MPRSKNARSGAGTDYRQLTKGIAMPPLIVWLIGAAGVAVGAKLWAMAERKANEDLERVREQARDSGVRQLERDPVTGTYRPRKS